MKEHEIKNLLKIKEHLTDIKTQKIKQRKELDKEIDSIYEILSEINQLISSRSFSTAEDVLSEQMDIEDAARQELQNINAPKLIQKIYALDNQKLLVAMKFDDNSIIIRFPNPELTQITQTLYINYFVKPSLVSLKKIEQELTPSISKSFYGEHEYIDRITLQQVKNYESFEFIVEKMNDFIKSVNIKKQ